MARQQPGPGGGVGGPDDTSKPKASPPPAAAAPSGTPYNPYAYVPGGSSPEVSQAIQDAGYANPGPNPVYVPTDSTDPGSPFLTDTTSSATSGSSQGQHSGIGSVDWAALLGDYGLPQDVIDELNRIFSTTSSDINQAITLAQAYVRGTPWYATTYPGIQSGINSGLFTDEQGYRAYQGQINQIYQQYYGRSATAGEIGQLAASGKTATLVGKQFESAATQANFSDPLKALLSPDEMKALADEQVGIDSALGQHVTAVANLQAQTQTLYQNFYGHAASRDDLEKLVASGTDAATVAQQFATQENINGMNPAIKDLFTPDEIKQVALDQAGGISQNGVQLKALMDLALQLNPLYHQYTGNGVSRQEIEDTYSQGVSATTVGQQFAGKAYVDANKSDIELASGAFGTGQLDDSQLKAFGEEQAGLDTPLGQSLNSAYQKAIDRMHGAFKGVLASPALSLQSGRLAAPPKPPDVAA